MQVVAVAQRLRFRQPAPTDALATVVTALQLHLDGHADDSWAGVFERLNALELTLDPHKISVPNMSEGDSTEVEGDADEGAEFGMSGDLLDSFIDAELGALKRLREQADSH